MTAPNLVSPFIAARQATDLFERVVRYMERKRYQVDRDFGHLNIVYIEGLDPDGSPNPDTLDGWNDLRLVFEFTIKGELRPSHIAVATTEPGRSATHSAAARRRGGVARIAFGQYPATWRMGYHRPARYGRHHPALVQARPLPVHRDRDRDGIRTRDTLHVGMFGINQHSTRPGYAGDSVGLWSEGCLVGRDWAEHTDRFVPLLRTDPRFVADAGYLFTTTIIPGDAL